MSSGNELQEPTHQIEDSAMKDLFEIIGLNDATTVPWDPNSGTFNLPLGVQTKDGQITYIITTLPQNQNESQKNNEPMLQHNAKNNPGSASGAIHHPTQLVIHQSPIEEEKQYHVVDHTNGGALMAHPNTARNVEDTPGRVRLELWNPEESDRLTSVDLDNLASSPASVTPPTSMQCLKNFVVDDSSTKAFTITNTSRIADMPLEVPGPSFQHNYAITSNSMTSGSVHKGKKSRFKNPVGKFNSVKRKDNHFNQTVRTVTKGKTSKNVQPNVSPKNVLNRKKISIFQQPENTRLDESQHITSSPKKKRTIADWLAVGIDPTKLEENVDQVRNRFEKGCECTGEDDNCFDGINPEFVYRHRLNIAELTRAEHDMYLMGVTMATLANPDATERNSKRQRLRNAYVFLGREVCLDAWLYLENCTHYQLKRIRKHLITHGVSARVHGNQGKKPHNTFPFRSYQLAFEYLNNWFNNYAKKCHGSGGNRNYAGVSKEATHSLGYNNAGGRIRNVKQNPAPIQLAPEQTRKRLHQDYKKYFEKQAKKAMLKAKSSENDAEKEGVDEDSPSDEFKVMGYTSFSQFLKVRFPHVKFAKVELNNAKAISQATAAAAALSSEKQKNSNVSPSKTGTSQKTESNPNQLDNNITVVEGGADGNDNVIDVTNCEIEIVKRNIDSSAHEGEGRLNSDHSLSLLTATNQTQFVFSLPMDTASAIGDPQGNENESASIIYMVS